MLTFLCKPATFEGAVFYHFRLFYNILGQACTFHTKYCDCKFSCAAVLWVKIIYLPYHFVQLNDNFSSFADFPPPFLEALLLRFLQKPMLPLHRQPHIARRKTKQ